MLVSLVFSVLAFIINRKIGNRSRVEEIQKQINDYQKELKEASKAKDEKKIKELTERDKELTKNMQEMMWLSLKPGLILLPLFWIAYAFLLPVWFPEFIITDLPFHLPSSIMFWLPWKDYLGVRGLFIYSLLVFGLFFELVLARLWKKFKQKKLTEK